MKIAFSVWILVLASCLAAEAEECAVATVCQNGGTCRVVDGQDMCQCMQGFFGAVCGSLASSLLVRLGDDKVSDWLVTLKDLGVMSVIDVSTTDKPRSYRVIYNKTYSSDDANVMRTLLTRDEKAPSINDFNECELVNPCVAEHSACKNTVGSFQCTCESGYKVSNGQCQKEVDNTKKTIYIWTAVVSVLVVWMIILVAFINIRKIKRGKKLRKIAREREEIENQKQLNPTNLQTLQVASLSRQQRGESPLSSVFGDHTTSSSYARSDAPLYTGGGSEARNNPSRMSAPELMYQSPDSYYAGDIADGLHNSYPGKRYAQSLIGIEEYDTQSLGGAYPVYSHVNAGYGGSFQNLQQPYFPEKAVIPTLYGEQMYNVYDQR